MDSVLQGNVRCVDYSGVFTYTDRTQARAVRSSSRNTIEEVVGVNRRAHRTFEALEQRIDRLSLMCEAMWTLLEERSDLNVEDLERRIHELDHSDGRSDLRRQRTAVPCECGAMVPVAALGCQFCGAPVQRLTPFDAV